MAATSSMHVGGVDRTRGRRRAERGEERPPLAARTPSWVREALMYLPAALATPAALLGGLALAHRGPRWLRRAPIAGGILTVGALVGVAYWQLQRLFTEQPDYEVEGFIGDLEVRRYPARVVAETLVEDVDEDAAREEGFRRLAGFIFGGNRAKRTISMTTPVNIAAPNTARGERLDVTTPVTSGRAADGEAHVVTFTMPSDLDVASLPMPVDPRVVVRELPEQRVAVLRYRGTYSKERTARKREEIVRKLAEEGVAVTGEPIFAGYDPPSTLPFLRRVEVWAPI